ncbi:unnamed protein product [Mytilus coruscus]|uniref:Ig-like domain-containing protein n=1 Tax=Mytilus coruscus TaxID=42192 RepID=A0A6J8B1B4_MYTCO|nr:unnamed protein product [Mytilus coruscus]
MLTNSEPEIKWEIKTKPVILGKEAILTCNGYNCPPENSKKWLGGKNYDLLCFDNESNKSPKYVMMTNGTSFDLMIKNFSLSDTNCEYTCACGFLQYTNMLKLEDGNVMFPPTVNKTMYSEKDDKLFIDIAIKVYPLPTCEITYQEISSQVNITSTDIHEGHNGLHLVRLHHIFDLDHENCIGNLKLICKISSHNYIVTEEILDFCKDHHKKINFFLSDHLIIATSGGFVILIIIVSITVLACKFEKKRSKTNRKADINYKIGNDTTEKKELVIQKAIQCETDVHDREIMVPEVDDEFV